MAQLAPSLPGLRSAALPITPLEEKPYTLYSERPRCLSTPLWRSECKKGQLIGQTPEVPAEVSHTVQVRANGCVGEVAAAQLFKHELTCFVSAPLPLKPGENASNCRPPNSHGGFIPLPPVLSIAIIQFD
jgi:hypothetical protein